MLRGDHHLDEFRVLGAEPDDRFDLALHDDREDPPGRHEVGVEHDADSQALEERDGVGAIHHGGHAIAAHPLCEQGGEGVVVVLVGGGDEAVRGPQVELSHVYGVGDILAEYVDRWEKLRSLLGQGPIPLDDDHIDLERPEGLHNLEPLVPEPEYQGPLQRDGRRMEDIGQKGDEVPRHEQVALIVALEDGLPVRDEEIISPLDAADEKKIQPDLAPDILQGLSGNRHIPVQPHGHEVQGLIGEACHPGGPGNPEYVGQALRQLELGVDHGLDAEVFDGEQRFREPLVPADPGNDEGDPHLADHHRHRKIDLVRVRDHDGRVDLVYVGLSEDIRVRGVAVNGQHIQLIGDRRDPLRV